MTQNLNSKVAPRIKWTCPSVSCRREKGFLTDTVRAICRCSTEMVKSNPPEAWVTDKDKE